MKTLYARKAEFRIQKAGVRRKEKLKKKEHECRARAELLIQPGLVAGLGLTLIAI
jgi:hypothetical protein